MVCKLASGWPRQFCVMNEKHAVFDLVPLARSRRKVADGDAQPGLVGQFLQGDLPQSATRTVAPAAVRSDEQLPRFGKAAAAHPLPPTANGVHGKGRRVVVDANAHPTLVVENVVDPVGNGLAQKGVAEVMHADLFRLALRTPIPASILEIPDQFLLFRIHRDRRLTTVEEPRHLGVRCSNCAFRSGCEAPSRVLRLPCKLYPASSSKVATVLWLTGCVCRANSSANVRVLLIVHRSGDSGSPREVGSTKPSSASSNCGSFRIAGGVLRPAGGCARAAARPFRVAGPSTPRFQRERWMATCALLLPQPSRLPNPFPGPRSPPTTAATAR